MSYSIAIAVESGLEQPKNKREAAFWYEDDAKGWYDDKELAKSVMRKGHSVQIIDWEDATIDPRMFDAIFVSSTWNGCRAPRKYIEWLESVEADGERRLINGLELLKDNFVKPRYMLRLEKELEKMGHQNEDGYIIPSYFCVNGKPATSGVEALNGRTFADILSMLDQQSVWRQSNIVIKPAISADGIDTFVYNRFANKIAIDAQKKEAGHEIRDIDTIQRHFERLVRDQERYGIIIQPYIKGVENGEYSLTFFNDECQFAIQKPKLFKGDGSRRRQVVALSALPEKLLDFAHHIVKTAISIYGDGELTRTRADFFIEEGIPVLCELECVDPNTNFRVLKEKENKTKEEQDFLNGIFDVYANAILARVATLKNN